MATLVLEPLILELRYFGNCVRQDRPSRVPGSDGLRDPQLAEILANKVARQAFLNLGAS